MQRDRAQDGDDEEQDAQRVEERCSRPGVPLSFSIREAGGAAVRAHASAARMPETVGDRPPRREYVVVRHHVGDCGDDLRRTGGRPRLGEGGHAHLVGRVVDGGRRAAPDPGPCGRGGRRGRQTLSSGWKCQLAGRVQSTGGAASGSRWGPLSPSAIGLSSWGASPGRAWPRRRTRPWSGPRWSGGRRPRCGRRQPEQQMGLEYLEALVHQGRRVDGHHRPMAQLGCSSASSTVTSPSSAATGPETAPRSRSAPGGVPRRRSRRAGTAPVRSARSRRARSGRERALHHQRAADDQGLLVGEREGVAGVQRRQGRPEPDGTGDPVEHDVAGRARGRDRRLRRARRTPVRTGHLPAKRSGRPPAVSPTTRNRWGEPGRGPGPGCRSSRSTR